jgi:hypothetical protein
VERAWQDPTSSSTSQQQRQQRQQQRGAGVERACQDPDSRPKAQVGASVSGSLLFHGEFGGNACKNFFWGFANFNIGVLLPTEVRRE